MGQRIRDLWWLKYANSGEAGESEEQREKERREAETGHKNGLLWSENKMLEHFRDEEVKSDDKAQGVTLGVDGKESRDGSDWVKKSRG